MNPVETRWQTTRDSLLAEIAGRPIIACHVPQWQPVDLQAGLQWLQGTIYEGFSVAFRVVDSDSGALVAFKRWEFGETEPEWNVQA